MKHKHIQLLLALLLTIFVAAAGCRITGSSNSGLLALLGLGGSRPCVVSSMPADGAIGVSISTTVMSRFSRDMDPFSITSGTFTLRGGTLGPITGNVSYNPGTRTATFTLVSPANLEYLTRYTATITTGACDMKGACLLRDVEWSFTTVSAEGTMAAPTFEPLPGTHDAAVDITIYCTDGTATICYTTDNTTPSRTNGITYTGTPVHISQNTTLHAIAYRDGWEDSSPTEGLYNIRTVAAGL